MGCMCAKCIKPTGNYRAVLGRAFEIIERCSASASDVVYIGVKCFSDGSFWVTFRNNKNKVIAYTSTFKIDYSKRLEMLFNAVRNCINSDIWELYPGGVCPLNNEDKQNIIDYISDVVFVCWQRENSREDTSSLPSWFPSDEWERGRDPARSYTPFSPDEY